MPLAIVVNDTDNKVIQASSSGKFVVGDIDSKDGRTRYVLNKTLAEDYYTALNESRADGFLGDVFYDHSITTFTSSIDNRPVVTATTDKNEILANGTDSTTINLSVTPAVTKTYRYYLGEEYFKLEFVNGQCSIVYNTVNSGRFILQNTDKLRFSSPLTIHAFRG
jgi:hypothetical protein